MRDLTSYKSQKIKKLRFVMIDEWFPQVRDEGVDYMFYTILQESFFHSYVKNKVKFS